MSDDKYKRWKDNTRVRLRPDTVKHESFFKACSVSVVPDELRKWNGDAYMPKVISIGHKYYGRRELLPMEEIKWHCMFQLFNRSQGYTLSPDSYIHKCMDAILEADGTVRSSYVGEIELDRYDLAAIVFKDACFLLELLISGSSDIVSEIPIQGEILKPLKIGKMEVLMRDLILLENQIPLFVLDVLFRNIFDPDFHHLIHTVHDQALSLFGFHGDLRSVDFKFAHFLELSSWNINKEWEVKNRSTQIGSNVVSISEQVEYQCLNRCATKLKAFGVTIKPVIDDNPPKFGMEFSHNNGILEIPQVRFTRAMKSKWLNLIAWEHHKKWIKSNSISDTENENQHWRIATSSVLLFNDLICCSSDVQLLKDREVIVVDDDLNMKNQDMLDFFHSMTKGVDRGITDPEYSSNFDALNKYSAANRFKSHILLWHYFCQFSNWFYAISKFLGHGYNFAATALTLLTTIQAVYAMLSYHNPPKP